MKNRKDKNFVSAIAEVFICYGLWNSKWYYHAESNHSTTSLNISTGCIESGRSNEKI